MITYILLISNIVIFIFAVNEYRAHNRLKNKLVNAVRQARALIKEGVLK